MLICEHNIVQRVVFFFFWLNISLRRNFAFVRTPSFSPRVITCDPKENQYLVSGQLFEIDGLPNFLTYEALLAHYRRAGAPLLHSWPNLMIKHPLYYRLGGGG